MNCGHLHPAFGYSRYDPFRQLPEKKRRVIWVCGAQACRDRAEAWKKKADGNQGQAAKVARKTETPAAQAALF